MRRGGEEEAGDGDGKGKDREGEWREGRVEGGGRKGEGGEGIGLPPLPCPLTLSCPPNAEFLDPPMQRTNNEYH